MAVVEVQIDVTQPNGDYQRLSETGLLAGALRKVILRLGDHYANDADVQRLVEAVAAVEVKA